MAPENRPRCYRARALTLDFIAEAPNLVLVGRNGLGKRMIAQNICHAAVLVELHRQTPDGRRSKLRTYGNAGVLCIDEVGYLSFDDKAANLLYEVINRRYERKPVILTTNRPFNEWNEVPECDLHHAAGSPPGRRQLPGPRERAGNCSQTEEQITPVPDAAYIVAVLIIYAGLPDTPLRPSPQD